MGRMPMDEAQAGKLVDASLMLDEAFPAFRCLRCRHDQFLLRLVVGVSSADATDEADRVETTCKRCGMVETHRLGLLRDALLDATLPLANDD
jgi:hypothetical protein